MRDCCLMSLFSLGEATKDGQETLTRPCIYINPFLDPRQPLDTSSKTVYDQACPGSKRLVPIFL